MNSNRPPFAGWIRSSNTITQQFLSIGGRPDIESRSDQRKTLTSWSFVKLDGVVFDA